MNTEQTSKNIFMYDVSWPRLQHAISEANFSQQLLQKHWYITESFVFLKYSLN